MSNLLKQALEKHPLRFGRIGLAILLALAFVASALPQPVEAASGKAPCETFYTVQAGDTTNSIAFKFGVKWAYIFWASNLKGSADNSKVNVGTKLCIPPKWWPYGSPNTTFRATAKSRQLTVNLAGYAPRSKWMVIVSDAQKIVSGEFRVGRINASKLIAIKELKKVFRLPPALYQRPELMVCLKNIDTHQIICQQITNTP